MALLRVKNVTIYLLFELSYCEIRLEVFLCRKSSLDQYRVSNAQSY